MSADARSYLSQALDIMERNALLRHQVDWDLVRRLAFWQAQGARKPADVYDAIRFALQTVGYGHSRLLEPEQVRDAAASVSSPQGPEGRSLGHHVGYLSLPAVQGTDSTYERYIRQGREAVKEGGLSRACGWVVDVRGNHGGNMWPMLAVVGPVLGEGTVGMFVDADAMTYPWTIRDGVPHENGSRRTYGDSGLSAPAALPHVPVAVLTDGGTASAGEAVVVAFRGRPQTRSFGEATSGVPTGNTTHRLPDGALLVLTEAKDADRTGRSYDAAIPPDESVPAVGLRGTDADQGLRAAQNWLLEQPACQ
ncbi:S41 family peptidase [Streptomyces bambusae]|nr:S41 family peptidase [Streptomyces bambusae]